MTRIAVILGSTCRNGKPSTTCTPGGASLERRARATTGKWVADQHG
jgi:hypothetical protein